MVFARICLISLVLVLPLLVLARTPMKSLGADFNCPADQLLPSKQIPTNVNNVRPADIKVIGAVGDSLSVGCRSSNFEDELDEAMFLGNSFITGAEEQLESHITLANILRKFSPGLLGVSHDREKGFNVAVSGSTSDDLPRQARELVERIKTANASTLDKWKLITLFIGTNDLGILNCYRGHPNDPSISAEKYKKNIERSLEILKAGLPQSIIVIMSMWQPMLAIEAKSIILEGKRVACHNDSSTIAQRDNLIDKYRAAVYEIQNERKFYDEKFTVVVQAFADEYKDAFTNERGQYELSFYASDVFHLSKYGNAVIAKALWNSFLQPVGQKDKRAQLGNDDIKLICPTEEHPYIFTVDNSYFY